MKTRVNAQTHTSVPMQLNLETIVNSIKALGQQ